VLQIAESESPTRKSRETAYRSSGSTRLQPQLHAADHGDAPRSRQVRDGSWNLPSKRVRQAKKSSSKPREPVRMETPRAERFAPGACYRAGGCLTDGCLSFRRSRESERHGKPRDPLRDRSFRCGDSVLCSQAIMPISVGRRKYAELLDTWWREQAHRLVSQRNPADDDPDPAHVPRGTVARILKVSSSTQQREPDHPGAAPIRVNRSPQPTLHEAR